MIDQHFTPTWLADAVANAAPTDLSGLVIDPAAGMGSLLERMERRYGDAVSLAAVDNDAGVTAALSRMHPVWTVSHADTISARSRRSSQVWRAAARLGTAFVVLNPPFSYRGGPSRVVQFGNFRGRLSPALEFLAIALSELKPSAGAAAILPAGVVDGEKYSEFWDVLGSTYSVSVVEEVGPDAFVGVHAKTKLVRLSPAVSRMQAEHNTGESQTSTPRARSGCRCVEVIRGRVPRHRKFENSHASAPYIHTTELQQSGVTKPPLMAPLEFSTSGALTLLPRVGYPNNKIARFDSGPIVLSDCVLALRCADKSTDELHASLLESIDELRALYSGTGAPYVTLSRLTAFLQTKGWHPQVVAASASPGRCHSEACRLADSPVIERTALDIASGQAEPNNAEARIAVAV
ncbi:SAM-dependent DNA methyltransferase [Microbacterium lacticum]|uniref:SAM-dependent DNA methyltransferase n=1 Tax=Microbacterium lacticum TaxID=33885 RepID=UPI0018B0DA35|nr:SAM-dependent DNA methyltransferase [Microbacterium lacticum]MBF9335912.1 SAM-dependent DNA methyltransferase [Microbacterium lacticum]